jgi:hypothetical protein
VTVPPIGDRRSVLRPLLGRQSIDSARGGSLCYVPAVPAELMVIVDAGSDTSDALRSLRGWLTDDDELRGRVRVLAAPPPAGTLGGVADTLVAAAPLVGALVPAVVSWLRSRHSDLTLRIDRSDGGSVELTVNRLRRLDLADLPAEITDVVKALEASADATDGG